MGGRSGLPDGLRGRTDVLRRRRGIGEQDRSIAIGQWFGDDIGSPLLRHELALFAGRVLVNGDNCLVAEDLLRGGGHVRQVAGRVIIRRVCQ
ncbi:MAG TPA: hypothetical protein VKV80_03085 [Streptosporangiaceae bacterium]|nr:hypothetical protein [Streptosporangiaceae bacterium]